MQCPNVVFAFSVHMIFLVCISKTLLQMCHVKKQSYVWLYMFKVKLEFLAGNCFKCACLNPRCLLHRSTWPTSRKTENCSKKENWGRCLRWWRTRRFASRIIYAPLFFLLLKVLVEKYSFVMIFHWVLIKYLWNTFYLCYYMLKIQFWR